MRSIEAQREAPTTYPTVDELDFSFQRSAMVGRGLPFAHPAWAQIRIEQGQYMRQRGLLMQAEAEYCAAIACAEFDGDIQDCFDEFSPTSRLVSRAREGLNIVRSLRRDGAYGLDLVGQPVWRAGTAMALRYRF